VERNTLSNEAKAKSRLHQLEGLRNGQIGVDKTASELAIKRLKEEIAELETKINLILFINS
jgi:hypothetical protein